VMVSAMLLAAAAAKAEPAAARKLAVVVLEGSPYNRGLIHGKTLKTQIHDFVAVWKADLAQRYKMDADAFIQRFVKKTDYPAAIKKWTPELLEEIKGIAEGSGIDFDTIFVLQLIDEYWVNGDAVALEHCSALGVGKRGDRPACVAQTMDLEGFRDGFQVILHVKHEGSNLESFVLSHAGLIGLNGMNSKGIGVCCNTLAQLSNCRDGLPVACVVRGILEKQTEEDALKFVQSVKHASGQNYVIGASSRVFDFECSAGKVAPFTPAGQRDLVWHTNHPLANNDYHAKYRERLEKEKDAEKGKDNSSVRLQCVETRVRKAGDMLGVEQIKALLSSRDSAEHPVCRPFKTKKEGYTFASVIMVLADKPVMHVAPGPPDVTPYREFSFAK
jgi:isopenicillin-N N-acyltransferase-like protein